MPADILLFISQHLLHTPGRTGQFYPSCILYDEDRSKRVPEGSPEKFPSSENASRIKNPVLPDQAVDLLIQALAKFYSEGTYKDYIALTKASPFEFVGYDVIGVLDVGNGAGEPGIVKEQTDKMEEAYEIGKKF